MAKTNYIELGEKKHAEQIPILYEDRSVIAIDKPAGWMLVPFSWQKTNRNLQAAITSSIAAGSFWARCRNVKFLQFIHRLDADTTGILLFGKSAGAVRTYGELFESRQMEKVYLAAVEGIPQQAEWKCALSLAPNPNEIGKMKVDARNGKDAETFFKIVESRDGKTLVEAHPVTGRTHQIRVHLAESGHSVLGDPLYGKPLEVLPTKRQIKLQFPIGLRSVSLSYFDPFSKKRIRIHAPSENFVREFGFKSWHIGTSSPPEKS
ncbi:MAG: RluA family pseudouridine synthase [Verrucomicrobiota bacterium]